MALISPPPMIQIPPCPPPYPKGLGCFSFPFQSAGGGQGSVQLPGLPPELRSKTLTALLPVTETPEISLLTTTYSLAQTIPSLHPPLQVRALSRNKNLPKGQSEGRKMAYTWEKPEARLLILVKLMGILL